MKKIKASDCVKTVEWSNEDKCYIGSAPPLIAQCCHGKNESDVRTQLRQIVDEWIELYNKDGAPLHVCRPSTQQLPKS